jgi:ankyrin repeat protein
MQQQEFRDSMVPALVAAGADVNAKSRNLDCRSTTPLLVAAGQGATALMRTLIEAKADQTMEAGGSTAIELLLAAVKLENGNVRHSLLVSRLDVNTRNPVRTFAPSHTCFGLSMVVWTHTGKSADSEITR